MDINQTVGSNIKFARLARKLSREQLARKIGIKQQTIEKYELGKIQISVKRLSQITNALNIDLKNLLNDI